MKQNLFLDTSEELIKKNSFLVQGKKKRNIKIEHFIVDDENYQIIKRDKGDYYTITYDKDIILKHSKVIVKEVVIILKDIFKKYKESGKTLIIGLGNSDIPADAIGPEVTNKIIATNHYDDFLSIPKIALFNPEVTSKTGISSYQLIKMLVNNLKPNTIIIIDSMATNNINRLNNCIEISDTGIIPGSAINTNKEINSKTFGVPVIAIGVPLLISFDDAFYTTPDINEILNSTSDVISSAINTIFLN